MKKIIRNNKILLVAFFTMFSAVAVATPFNSETGKEIPVALSYAGSIQDQPMFQLSFFGNKDQDDFTISISDAWGNNLYRENFKAENFTKKFLLNTDEIGDETLLFKVTSNKTGKTVTYEVNRFTREGAIPAETK